MSQGPIGPLIRLHVNMPDSEPSANDHPVYFWFLVLGLTWRRVTTSSTAEEAGNHPSLSAFWPPRSFFTEGVQIFFCQLIARTAITPLEK